MADNSRVHSGPPRYAFLGGCWYGGTELRHPGNVIARPKLGDRYGYFRVDDQTVEGILFRSGSYLKAPIAVVQSLDRAALWEIPLQFGWGELPFVGWQLGVDEARLEGRSLPATCHRKSRAHFGDWETETRSVPTVEFGKTVRFDGKDWRDLVRDYATRKLILAEPTESEWWRTVARLAKLYLGRAYSPAIGLHAEFMRRNLPTHLGGNDLFSLVTYELMRAAVLERWGEATRARGIWDRLVLDDRFSVALPELGACRLWHNTIALREGQPVGVTEYASGFAGYPGGQAGFLVAACELLTRQLAWPGRDRLRAGVEWLLQTQLPDGGWPLVVPTVPEKEDAAQRQATPPRLAVGATAACARALLAAAAVWNEPAWRDAGLRGLVAINPLPPTYAFVGSGYLRDAGEEEQDGVSGVEMIHANLAAWRQTREPRYLETATAFGAFLIPWLRGWGDGKCDCHEGYADPMVSSFSPRLALWDTMLWAEAFLALAEATGDSFWRRLGESTASRAVRSQDQVSGGWSETDVLDGYGGVRHHYIENGITVWGLRLAERLGVSPAELEFKPATDDPAARPVGVEAYLVPEPGPAGGGLRRLARRLLPRALKRRLRRLGAPAESDETVPDLSVIPVGGTAPAALGWELLPAGPTLASRSGQPVRRILFPVLAWNEPAQSVAVKETVGKNARRVAVTLPSRVVEVTFSVPVDRVAVIGGKLVCETTLKAFWNAGAELTVNLACREMK